MIIWNTSGPCLWRPIFVFSLTSTDDSDTCVIWRPFSVASVVYSGSCIAWYLSVMTAYCIVVVIIVVAVTTAVVVVVAAAAAVASGGLQWSRSSPTDFTQQPWINSNNELIFPSVPVYSDHYPRWQPRPLIPYASGNKFHSFYSTAISALGDPRPKWRPFRVVPVINDYRLQIAHPSTLPNSSCPLCSSPTVGPLSDEYCWVFKLCQCHHHTHTHTHTHSVSRLVTTAILTHKEDKARMLTIFIQKTNTSTLSHPIRPIVLS